MDTGFTAFLKVTMRNRINKVRTKSSIQNYFYRRFDLISSAIWIIIKIRNQYQVFHWKEKLGSGGRQDGHPNLESSGSTKEDTSIKHAKK